MSHTVELVTFRLREGSEPGFVAANAVVNEWLGRQPGFLSRHLARKPDGEWVDMVMWESNSAAWNAAERILSQLGESEAMLAIDPDTMVMSHAAVGLSFAA